MTYKDLFQLVVDLNGGNEAYVKAAGLPQAMERTASMLWVNQAPETDKTRVLRYQLVHLERVGRFDVREE